MLGFAIGSLCFLGLASLMAGPRCYSGPRHHRGRGHHPHAGHHGPPWSSTRRARRARGRGGFARAAGEIFKRRLDLDEEQSDLVDHALTDLHRATRDLTKSLKAGRTDLASALAGEKVDDAALAALFSTQDSEVARFRREAVSALKQVHAVLEPDQRAEAIRWLDRERDEDELGGWV